jgi:hypothetical protein
MRGRSEEDGEEAEEDTEEQGEEEEGGEEEEAGEEEGKDTQDMEGGRIGGGKWTRVDDTAVVALPAPLLQLAAPATLPLHPSLPPPAHGREVG